MTKGKFIGEYQKNAVTGASPVQLVVMLYDGALKWMRQGREAIAQGDLPQQNQCLQRAQKIVLELMSSLDMQRGGEIASNLLGLYGFVVEQLVLANVEDKPEPIDHCIAIFTELRSSWIEVDRIARTQSSEVPLAA